MPVLGMAGALDRTTPVEDVRLVGKKYAGAEYREYPHNAHYLIDEPNTMKILVDLIAVPLFAWGGLYATSIVYDLLLGLSIDGLIQWRRAAAQEAPA